MWVTLIRVRTFKLLNVGIPAGLARDACHAMVCRTIAPTGANVDLLSSDWASKFPPSGAQHNRAEYAQLLKRDCGTSEFQGKFFRM